MLPAHLSLLHLCSRIWTGAYFSRQLCIGGFVVLQAALCSVRIVRKVPDLVEYMTVPATGLLTDKHHGVLVSGVKLCTELCQANELALDHFRKVCVKST
jgi:hypothetical protein